MTAKRAEPAGKAHTWEFKARFRRRAYGWRSQPAITRACEAVLLSSGLVDEAYQRYGLEANQAGTYRATLAAAARDGRVAEAKDRVRKVVAAEEAGGFVRRVLERELGL